MPAQGNIKIINIMVVYINDKESTVDRNYNISKLINFLKIENTNGVAIALNNEVISKANWDSIYLKENDNILVIKATQGG